MAFKGVTEDQSVLEGILADAKQLIQITSTIEAALSTHSLVGRGWGWGWGWGSHIGSTYIAKRATPSPKPPLTRGEGADRVCRPR